jgi:hypothetical protein
VARAKEKTMSTADYTKSVTIMAGGNEIEVGSTTYSIAAISTGDWLYMATHPMGSDPSKTQVLDAAVGNFNHMYAYWLEQQNFHLGYLKATHGARREDVPEEELAGYDNAYETELGRQQEERLDNYDRRTAWMG